MTRHTQGHDEVWRGGQLGPKNQGEIKFSLCKKELESAIMELDPARRSLQKMQKSDP